MIVNLCRKFEGIRVEKREFVPISVIIPVYNVNQWLDECMESVVTQTFKNFEVILINDGSTDGSEIKCQKWAQKDSRVRPISKKNEGLSVTRNYGIEIANGEYLVFIDSDDWIDSTYLEKLYSAILESNASISECDVYRFHDDTKEMTYRNCAGDMGRLYTLEEHMQYGYTAIWKCMIKKSLFVEHNITFPDCHSPARAVYPLLLALSGNIVNVQEGLYYYRRFRQGSLSEKPRVNNGDEQAVGLNAFDSLLDGFKRCGIYDKYEKLLKRIIKIKLSDMLAGLFYRRDPEEYKQLVDKYYAYIEQKFPGTTNFKYVTLGGYNLNRILSNMDILHNPNGRFNFSSIISIMNPIQEAFSLVHHNKYREIMVRRDAGSSFWNLMEEIGPQYIFIDFIEERFDLLGYAKGYVTKSDAFDGIQTKPDHYHLIKFGTKECIQLWEKSVDQFLEKVRSRFPNCNIVLVENYLSEEVGDLNGKMLFAEIDSIREVNKVLKRYYEYVSDNYEWILTVDASKCNYYFTDCSYEYGAIPSHLNEIVNKEVAKHIEEVIGI